MNKQRSAGSGIVPIPALNLSSTNSPLWPLSPLQIDNLGTRNYCKIAFRPTFFQKKKNEKETETFSKKISTNQQ